MKEVNDKKESMKPMSQAAVELDDEALDQVSGGLKRLDSDWKPENNRDLQVMRLHQKRPWWFMPGMQKTNVNSKRKDKFKTVLCFQREKTKTDDQRQDVNDYPVERTICFKQIIARVCILIPDRA